MNLIENIKKVNIAIIKLIKSDEDIWIKQREKLRQLLQFHLQLLEQCNANKPDMRTLNYIESIKQWRTDNLNTKENMKDDRYGKDIASEMCNVKVQIMSQVLRPF